VVPQDKPPDRYVEVRSMEMSEREEDIGRVLYDDLDLDLGEWEDDLVERVWRV
jgi:hypothetical protein